MKDYYSILGLTKTATSIDIRNAYKKLSLKYHPDRNINGTEKFKEISEAYQILYNSITREKYDYNKNIDYNFKNPKDIWNSLFPKEIPQKLLNELINKYFINLVDIEKLDFDIFYKYLLNIFNKISKDKDKSKIDHQVLINVEYDIKDHFQYKFNKDIFLDIKSKSIDKTLSFNIDTRIEKQSFERNIINDKKIYKIMININVKPYINPIIRLIDNYNILLNIPISLDIYQSSGFYYNYNLYGNSKFIYFKYPNKSFLLYKIKNLGKPINLNTIGSLYIKFYIDNKNSITKYIPKENDYIYYSDMVNFFIS